MNDLSGFLPDRSIFILLSFQMEHTLYILGKITKTHGYDGTVVIVSSGLFHDESESLKNLFVVIDGLYVPFPVEDFVMITNSLAHVNLEFVDNLTEARKLIGCDTYSDLPQKKQDTDEKSEQLIGFTVHDSNYGKIGVVQKIEDYNGNIVMNIKDGKKETLISMFPELVTNIDDVAKRLFIEAPEGYF